MNKQETIESIAAVCYAANSEYRKLLDEAPGLSWEQCKDSTCSGVEKALAGQTPEQLHESWCHFKRLTGWSYGGVLDVEGKKHPCLVPYTELPELQKKKDELFSGLVHHLSKF